MVPSPALLSPVAALHSPSRDGRPHGRPTERGDAVDDRVDKAAASGERPENPPQGLEKLDSAPGLSSQTAEAAPADTVSTSGLFLSLLRSAEGRRDLRFGLSGLRAGAHGVAPRHGPAAAVRPENPAQGPEKIKSAPEEANASASTPLFPLTAPSGARFANARMTPNGAAACRSSASGRPERRDVSLSP